MLTLTLLFTDSFQPISFSSHCNGVCVCVRAFGVGIAIFQQDISECRTHDTSHASISSINIYNISDPFSTECTHSKETKPKKGCRKSEAVAVLVRVVVAVVTAGTVAKSEVKPLLLSTMWFAMS